MHDNYIVADFQRGVMFLSAWSIRCSINISSRDAFFNYGI